MVSCVFSYPLKLQISVSFNKWFYYASVTYLLYLVVNILIAEKFLWMKSFILLKSKFESVPLIFCQASLWPLPHISPPSHLFLIASSCRASFPPSCHPCELLPQSYVASQPPSHTVPLSAIPPLSLFSPALIPSTSPTISPPAHFSSLAHPPWREYSLDSIRASARVSFVLMDTWAVNTSSVCSFVLSLFISHGRFQPMNNNLNEAFSFFSSSFLQSESSCIQGMSK